MNAPTSPGAIVRGGLWQANPGLVQLLGLCPLLAVSTTVVNGISLGLATMLVMGLTNASVALVRGIVPRPVRIPVFMIVIAVLVTVVQMLMNAFMHPLYAVLGIFVPLIVSNCIVLARAETFASRQPPLPALLDGLAMGAGLMVALALLGGLREVIGKGTLLSGLDLALGPAAAKFVIHLTHGSGLLLAMLPPGAFILLGLLIAARNLAVGQR